MNNKLNEGETLFADGKFDEAEKCFLSLVESDSDCKEAYKIGRASCRERV